MNTSITYQNTFIKSQYIHTINYLNTLIKIKQFNNKQINSIQLHPEGNGP